MTVNQLAQKYSFKSICLPCKEREVKGGYCGDLLSWVMGHATSDNVWITIMSNVNVLAVASLTDVACIILAEGVEPDDEVIKTAIDKDINILSSELGAFEISVLIGNDI
ncbi:MAG: hypothetical protein II802_03255 [Clostridia bacterium]|nr:hypothetical protein [Clostridia bacterium]